MIGLMIGAICGLAELYLLIKLTVGFAKKGSAFVAAIFFVKLFLFALAAALVLIFARDSLLWFAIGVSGVMLIGSAIIFCRQAFGGKGNG